MSTFRKHKSVVDRSAADRARHKKKIEKAIKESIKDVVAEESIIGQNGKKKIRIPVKGLKEYRFVYGTNEQKEIGSAGNHHIKRGQKISKRTTSQEGETGAGNKEGEEKYEVEITLEELAEYLFQDLELPDLEKKRFRHLEQSIPRRKGYRFEGIRPRLSKKETLKRKIRRKKRAIKSGTYDPDSEERFPFHQDDMKYHHMKPTPKENTSAVVFLLMDVSGSMTQQKKYIARSYFFLMYQFLRHRYDNIEVVFISHTTTAKQVTEDEFFKRISVGGTLVSSALELELDLIKKQYHPNSWNVYTFYCGDGDNWHDDNERALTFLRELKEINQLVVYAEINERPPEPDAGDTLIDWHSPSFEAWREDVPDSMWTLLTQLQDHKFKRVLLTHPDKIWGAFKKIFGVKS
tara:strand:+ start:10144 stop:11358 length:1215 start_codon:yes stop_codon:yes gene_type:complete